MRAVFLLQNQWFKDPKRAQNSIDRITSLLDGDELKARSRFIPRSLFAGCRTGQIILKDFDEILHDVAIDTIFEEASKELHGYPRIVPAPDPLHVKAIIDYYSPDAMILLGRIAESAYDGIGYREDPCRIFRVPHPTTRRILVSPYYREVVGSLQALAREKKV